MLEQAEVDPGSSLELEPQDSNYGDQEVEDFVQDQVIILPEVMSKILEQLDLRSLKTVRLVCKSWLREAQTHLEKRGTVRLITAAPSTRIDDFIDVTQGKLPGLPQPLKSINVDFRRNNLRPKEHLSSIAQLSSLSPPLGITHFYSGKLPLKLVFPLILRCSSTLETLELFREGGEDLPSMDPEQTFPKLRSLVAAITTASDTTHQTSLYPSIIIAWIVKASPNLESFEHLISVEPERGSKLLLQLDMKNVKTLNPGVILLNDSYLNGLVLENFGSIPFPQLRNLRLFLRGPSSALAWGTQAILKTIANSMDTCRTLDLSNITRETQLGELNFPVCTNVLELTVSSLSFFSENVFPNHFPSLQTLTVRRVDEENQAHLDSLPPFTGVKTFRMEQLILMILPFFDDRLDLSDESRFEFKLFDKFPALESLSITVSLLMRCCRLIATGNPKFSSLLAGVKHLELYGPYWCCSSRARPEFQLSSLVLLKGIETITMLTFDEAVGTIPVKYLPHLKVVQFPWGNCLDIQGIVEMAARGVERVVVTNCCSAPRLIKDQRSLELLETFFKSVPNAECGCGNRRRRRPKMNLFYL